MPGADYVWVEDLYPGAAIVNAGDDAVFRIPVTDDGDTVTLSPRTEWQPVERVTRYEDAAKALSGIADRLDFTRALRAVAGR